MDVQRLHRLAAFIASGQIKLDMHKVRVSEGAGCIGAQARLLFPEIDPGPGHTLYRFMEGLGLSQAQTRRLCYDPRDAVGEYVLYEDVTIDRAVNAINTLIKTGVPVF